MGFDKETEEVVKKLNLEKKRSYPDVDATNELLRKTDRVMSIENYREWIFRYIDIFESLKYSVDEVLNNAHECRCAWAIRGYGDMASMAEELRDEIDFAVGRGRITEEEGRRAVRDISQRINNDFPIELQNEMNHNCHCLCKIPYNTFMGRWKD